jgi:hypothetical protein
MVISYSLHTINFVEYIHLVETGWSEWIQPDTVQPIGLFDIYFLGNITLYVLRIDLRTDTYIQKT